MAGTKALRHCGAALMIAAGLIGHAVSGAVQRFEFRIENGLIAESRNAIRVKRGDTIELHWQADRRTVVHLHGYEIEITVEPGRPQTMRLQANATGRFAIESHDPGKRHRVLLYLEVHPR